MQTVDRWSGRETRQLRHALRLTVRGFAEDLGVCVRTVSKWEALGPALIPRPEIQAALDTMLRRAKDEDQKRFHASIVPSPPAMGATAWQAGPAWLRAPLPVDSQHVAVALQDACHYLDTATVGYFRSRLTWLKEDDARRGGSAVLPLLLGILGAIQKHAGEVNAALRRDLLVVGADGAEFAGHLYRDGQDPVRALYWHDRAIEWAQQAAAAPLQGVDS